MGIMKYPMGTSACNWDFFIIPKFINWDNKIISERVNREIANFHLLRWHTTKVVKVVVCARSPILLSLQCGFQPVLGYFASVFWYYIVYKAVLFY